MPATATDLFEAAIGRNRKNQPDVTQVAPELLTTLNLWGRALHAAAARINPSFFGKTDAAGGGGGSFTKPDDAELVFHLTDDNGPVLVVDPDNVDADPEVPVVVRWGRGWTVAAGVTGPTGSLTVWYSASWEELPLVTSELGELWREAHNELLVLRLAHYLAEKDGRSDEAATIEAQLQTAIVIFLRAVEYADANVIRSQGHARATQGEVLTDLVKLLGSSDAP